MRETTSTPAVPVEEEAAQYHSLPTKGIGLVEKKERVAFRTKLSLVCPRVEFTLPECSSQRLAWCLV